MCLTPAHGDPSAERSLGHVVRCERVELAGRAALIRVTLELGATSPSDAAGARLVVDERGRTRRIDPLPAPMPGGAATVTLGFAVGAAATALGLDLGRLSLVLPEPAALALSAPRPAHASACDPEPVAPEPPAQPPDGALGAVRQARLDDARRDAALAEIERDEALRAVARAEAAAHDANARAATFARRLAARGRRPRRATRLAAAACALGPAALLVAILAWPARYGDAEHGGGGVAAASASPVEEGTPAADPIAARLQIPADYLARYRQAAARYGLDWTFLAAVGAIESGHGRARAPGILSGANQQGAIGPAQFLRGTWERFGLDGDGDGDRDPHDPADAIPAMASYLRASGAPQDWRGALRSYNHSDAYVGAVEALAARLRSTGSRR